MAHKFLPLWNTLSILNYRTLAKSCANQRPGRLPNRADEKWHESRETFAEEFLVTNEVHLPPGIRARMLIMMIVIVSANADADAVAAGAAAAVSIAAAAADR